MECLFGTSLNLKEKKKFLNIKSNCFFLKTHNFLIWSNQVIVNVNWVIRRIKFQQLLQRARPSLPSWPFAWSFPPFTHLQEVHIRTHQTPNEIPLIQPCVIRFPPANKQIPQQHSDSKRSDAPGNRRISKLPMVTNRRIEVAPALPVLINIRADIDNQCPPLNILAINQPSYPSSSNNDVSVSTLFPQLLGPSKLMTSCRRCIQML